MDPEHHAAYEDIFGRHPAPRIRPISPPPPESIPAPARAAIPPPSARLPSHLHPQQQQYVPQYSSYLGGLAPPSIRAPSLRPSYKPGVPAALPDPPTEAQGLTPAQAYPAPHTRVRPR
ncbi:hypothetical protein B0H13DRAFT_2329621 [Mycena leptocephala]|nr:hypothetical protein B0H13DRAFT_2329621 [Mycena leptocephala]